MSAPGDVGDETMAALGLEPGTAAPDFSLESCDGEQVTLADLLRRNLPLLLVFTSPTHGQRSMLMPRLAAWQRDHRSEVAVALVGGGQLLRVTAETETEGLEHVLLDADLTVHEAYEVGGTPSAVLVGPDATIAAWTAAGSERIEALLDEALARFCRTSVER